MIQIPFGILRLYQIIEQRCFPSNGTKSVFDEVLHSLISLQYTSAIIRLIFGRNVAYCPMKGMWPILLKNSCAGKSLGEIRTSFRKIALEETTLPEWPFRGKTFCGIAIFWPSTEFSTKSALWRRWL
jgi:hypothetical protein